MEALFPLESQLPQEMDLSDGWNHYLVEQWSGPGSEAFADKLERGEHAFRTRWLEEQLRSAPLGHRVRRSLFVLGLIVLWNLLFSVVIWQTLSGRTYAHHLT